MKRILILVLTVIVISSCKQNNTEKIILEAEASVQTETTKVDTSSIMEFIYFKNNVEDKDDFDGEEGFIDSDDMSIYPQIIENNKKYWVVEGDILMNRSEFLQYKGQADALIQFCSSPKLIGIIEDNSLVKQPDHLDMKYAIIKSSFGSNVKEYEMVKKNLETAAKEWEAMCNVKFRHFSNLDTTLGINDNPSSLTFVVKKRKTTAYAAAAFFPNYPKARRTLRISPRYFLSTYDKVGILRHEIGHMLGFLHEQIAARVTECKEITRRSTRQLTQYDPKSVMHYFCKGIGDKKLQFTKLDEQGALLYYPF